MKEAGPNFLLSILLRILMGTQVFLVRSFKFLEHDLKRITRKVICIMKPPITIVFLLLFIFSSMHSFAQGKLDESKKEIIEGEKSDNSQISQHSSSSTNLSNSP